MSQPATFLRVKRRRDESPLETIVLENFPSKQHRSRQDTTTALANILSSLEIDLDQQTKTHSSGFVSRGQNLSKYLPPSSALTLFDSIRVQSEEAYIPPSRFEAEDVPDTNITVVPPRKCSSPPHPVLLSSSPPSVCVVGSLPDVVETRPTADTHASEAQIATTMQSHTLPSSTAQCPFSPTSPLAPPTPPSGLPTTSTVVYRRVATLPPVRTRVRRRGQSPTQDQSHDHAKVGPAAGEAAEDTRHRKRQLTDDAHAALLRAQLSAGVRLGAEGLALAPVGAVDAASAPAVAFVDVSVAANAAALRQSRKHRVELARLREQRERMACALTTYHAATETYQSERSAAVLGRARADRSALDALYGAQEPGASYDYEDDDAAGTLTGALYHRYCHAAVPRRGGQAVYTQRVDAADALVGMDADTAAFLSAKRAQHGHNGDLTTAAAQDGGALRSCVCACTCGYTRGRSPDPHVAVPQHEDDRLAALFERGQASGRAAQAIVAEDDDAFLARLQAQPLSKDAPSTSAEAENISVSARGVDNPPSMCVCECTCAAADTEQAEEDVFDVYEPVPAVEIGATGMTCPGADSHGAVSVCVLTGAELEELFGEDVELLHEGEWGYGRDLEDSDVDADADALEIDYPDEDDSEDSGMDEYDAEEAEFVMHCLRMRRDDEDDDEEGYDARGDSGYRQTLPSGVRVAGGRERWGYVEEGSDEDDEYGGSNTFARMRTWMGAASGGSHDAGMGSPVIEKHHRDSASWS